MNNTLFIAIQSLLKQKLRVFLTILSISIGISATIVVFAAGSGLDNYIIDQVSAFGSDTINIEVKVPSTRQESTENASGQAQGNTITTFKNSDVDAIRKHPNVSHIYGGSIGQEVVSYQNQIEKIMLMGTGYEADIVNNYKILSGRMYTKAEQDVASQVAVLGYGTANDLFGDNDPVGQRIKIKGKKFLVIGVMEEVGTSLFLDMDTIIYVPVTTLQKKLQGTDYISFAMAKMIDTEKAEATVEELNILMRIRHDITDPDKDDFASTTMAEATEMLGSIIDAITILLVSLVCISLIVGGVGIMNIMYVSVSERTFEIGLRKAVGAKEKNILYQFLIEAITITVSGGILGIFLGIILSYLVSVIANYYNFNWEYTISFFSIALALGFSVFIGVLFGLYPAKKAANLHPIDALRK